MPSSSISKKNISKSRIFLFVFIGIIAIIAAIAIPYHLSLFKTDDGVTDISVQEAKNMMDDNILYSDLLVLDVRTQEEYDEGHIEDVMLLPIDDLELRMNELSRYNDSEIIIYCSVGLSSAKISNILLSANFTKIYNMIGGYNAWTTARY